MTKNTGIALSGVGLTKKESRTILERAATRDLPPDTFVLQNGYRSDSLHIIVEGRVKTFLTDSNGNETVIAHLGPGEYIGGTGFDEGPASVSIMTVEPSRFLVLPKRDCKAFLPKNHLFAARVFEKIVREAEEHARELSEALQQKSAISEILRAISNSPTNVQALLESLAENVARLCDVTDAEILQLEGDELRLVAKYGSSRKWMQVGNKRRINRNWVTGRSVVDRTPIHVIDLQAAEAEFPEGWGYAKKSGHRTTFAAPLMREGNAIGAILIRRFEVRPLTDKQIALLMTFADQAAIAIENVRLFNEIQEKSRKVQEQARELAEWNAMLETRVAAQVAQLEQLAKLEHELSLASEIQQSMVPRSTPRLEGYEFSARMIPAKSVGGDFFDFIPLTNDVLAIAVGDVSDKGVPAALFMAMVRSLLRAEAHPGHSPKEVLQRVNRHLLDMNDKEMFVTILFGTLNRTTRQFLYARAGHEPPILCDAQGTVKRLPRANGQALGIFDTVALNEQTIELSKNRMMLLYSDGITDATNRQNERFGFKGIRRTISRMPQSPAGMVCDKLINALAEHQGDSLQYDDMTVVVVRAV